MIGMFLSILLLLVLIIEINSFIINSQRKSSSSSLITVYNIVNVEFLPTKDEFLPTKVQANPLDKLSDVAENAKVTIPYKCRKGECGTCEVRVGGKWIRTCTSSVADVLAISPDTSNISITVRPSTIKKPSKFFSPRSFIEGVYNNGLGVIGFVWKGIRENKKFDERMSKEEMLKRKVEELKSKKEGSING